MTMPLSAVAAASRGEDGENMGDRLRSLVATAPGMTTRRRALSNAEPPMQRAPVSLSTRYVSSAFPGDLQAAHKPPAVTMGPATAAAATAAAAAASASNVTASEPQVVMCSIGFGIDLGHTRTNPWDATEASVRALRDAMERSTLRLPFLSTLSNAQLQIQVKLGVPPKRESLPMDPMVVDMGAVTAVLPRSIPVLPIQVVTGGISVPVGPVDVDPTMITAVASVTIQCVPERPAPATAAAQQALASSPWSQLDSKSDSPAKGAWSQQLDSSSGSPRMKAAPAPAPAAGLPSRRVDSSMDMLAHISAAVRESIVNGASLAPAASKEDEEDDDDDDESTESEQADDDDESMEVEKVSKRPPKTGRKLAPGLTQKKNARRFVQHNYHDHANEEEKPGDEAPLSKGLDAPFPVKMHNILSMVEKDGYADVMSWLPHGRSFKIHDLDRFHGVILPVYFRHTKKSSLLRQLNLYSFRRICAGPDKGSYYHELFLRGKRFLAARMVRQKVNGNRIRSAGNPDQEPNFAKYPPMPPDNAVSPHTRTVSSEVSEEEDETDELPFPLKLQRMLIKVETDGQSHIVSWLAHGRAWRIHNAGVFCQNVMPKYLKMTKYTAFQKKMDAYNFKRVTTGPEKDAFYHEFFVRDAPELCRKMTLTTRIHIQDTKQNRSKKQRQQQTG